MEINLRSGEVCLQDNQPVRLNGARGLRWITQTGVAEDVFLHPGQSCRICNNALALVESVGGGKIRIEQAETFALLKLMRNSIQNLTHPRESFNFVQI